MKLDSKDKSKLSYKESNDNACKTSILLLFILLMVFLAMWNNANSALLDYATLQYIKGIDGLSSLIPKLNVPKNIYIGIFNSLQLCVCCLFVFGMLFSKIMKSYINRSRKTVLCLRIYALITVLNLIYMIVSVAIVFKMA